ncbi:hypothetical protein Tco_1556318 [Tanacetum coccineum]
MTDDDQSGANQHNVSQEYGFKQEGKDAHMTLTTVHDTQKTKGLMQSSFVSSDFTKKLLNFENVSPSNNEIASLMNTIVRHEEPSDFSSIFKFNDRVTKLETGLSEMKQVNQYAQAIYSIHAIIDHYIDNKLGEAIHKATLVIEQNVTESLEAIVLANFFSQPKSTYEAAASLSEYELTKILLDKIEESKSHLRADYKRKLYDAMVESYNTDNDLFDMYGEVFTLKRSQDEKDKDQDPSAGSDRGTKRRKSSKEADLPMQRIQVIQLMTLECKRIKSLTRKDELHKFSDGTLDSVQTALHDITLGIRMDYLPKKKWSRLDKWRSRVMIHNIDKLLFERRLMRNLNKFVSGREYENDLRLLERTI